ncbi:MAG: phosphoribosylformylglycinamidine cyclo-ligase [Clostridiales bacterium]|nr:phosphoribosylformylglycinamidine cyclo-ligase [Clostridiales bacterium]
MSEHRNSQSDSYKAAGVDITAGYRAVELMKRHIARTLTGEAGRGAGAAGIGGFGGMFELDVKDMPRPVLVSGTDGVGTKLKLAFLLDRHDTVGIDCVAMCANDILCCGAKPLFFLDYIACGRNVPERIAELVSGVAEGCVQAGCALVGGETAEMPGFYHEDEYDIAGFCVGAVDKSKILDKEQMRPGDAVIALPSSGAHSNGFSLIRKALGPKLPKFAEELLTPTKIYVKPMLNLFEAVTVHSAAHITGGGFYENIPRALKKGMMARLNKRLIRTPEIFGVIAKEGGIPQRDMFNTFNMGVGMVAVVKKDEAGKALQVLNDSGEKAYVLGEIAEGEGIKL